MSEDERALLNTVIAYPTDDMPRLVYADYLEETATRSMCEACDGTGVIEAGRGRQKVCAACTLGYVSDGRAERAEFIRIQCELSSLGFPGPLSVAVARTVAAGHLVEHDDPAHESLVFRSCELLVQWGESWGDHFGITLWSRGFIDEVRCDVGEWVGFGGSRAQRIGPALVKCHPVRKVALQGLAPYPTISRDQWSWNSRNHSGSPTAIASVPVQIHRLLSGYEIISDNRYDVIKFYLSERAALSALSDAAVAWAKAEAS